MIVESIDSVVVNMRGDVMEHSGRTVKIVLIGMVEKPGGGIIPRRLHSPHIKFIIKLCSHGFVGKISMPLREPGDVEVVSMMGVGAMG